MAPVETERGKNFSEAKHDVFANSKIELPSAALVAVFALTLIISLQKIIFPYFVQRSDLNEFNQCLLFPLSVSVTYL